MCRLHSMNVRLPRGSVMTGRSISLQLSKHPSILFPSLQTQFVRVINDAASSPTLLKRGKVLVEIAAVLLGRYSKVEVLFVSENVGEQNGEHCIEHAHL